jgi:hypothetical protein
MLRAALVPVLVDLINRYIPTSTGTSTHAGAPSLTPRRRGASYIIFHSRLPAHSSAITTLPSHSFAVASCLRQPHFLLLTKMPAMSCASRAVAPVTGRTLSANANQRGSTRQSPLRVVAQQVGTHHTPALSALFR